MQNNMWSFNQDFNNVLFFYSNENLRIWSILLEIMHEVKSKEDNSVSLESCVWGTYLRSRWHGAGCTGPSLSVLEAGDLTHSFICGGTESTHQYTDTTHCITLVYTKSNQHQIKHTKINTDYRYSIYLLPVDQCTSLLY